jgi:FixJ family two-component response regulator
MNGFELHDRLTAEARVIPTIFVTAFPDAKGNDRAVKVGAVGYLSKPCRRQDLLACIQSALGHRKE